MGIIHWKGGRTYIPLMSKPEMELVQRLLSLKEQYLEKNKISKYEVKLKDTMNKQQKGT